MKSLMRSEGENTRKEKKIANKQGKATYKGMGTGGSCNERDRNVKGVRQ